MRIFGYIGEVFSDACPASFSRWATAVTVGVGCWALVHLVRSTGKLPDPLDLAALAAWMTSPYGIGKVAELFGKPTST